MANNSLPDAKRRRDLLSGNPDKLEHAARDFFEAGRTGEALECLEATGDESLLTAIRDRAVEDGDYFLYKRSLHLLAAQAEPDHLARLRERALDLGKEAYAAAAARALED